MIKQVCWHLSDKKIRLQVREANRLLEMLQCARVNEEVRNVLVMFISEGLNDEDKSKWRSEWGFLNTGKQYFLVNSCQSLGHLAKVLGSMISSKKTDWKDVCLLLSGRQRSSYTEESDEVFIHMVTPLISKFAESLSVCEFIQGLNASLGLPYYTVGFLSAMMQTIKKPGDMPLHEITAMNILGKLFKFNAPVAFYEQIITKLRLDQCEYSFIQAIHGEHILQQINEQNDVVWQLRKKFADVVNVTNNQVFIISALKISVNMPEIRAPLIKAIQGKLGGSTQWARPLTFEQLRSVLLMLDAIKQLAPEMLEVTLQTMICFVSELDTRAFPLLFNALALISDNRELFWQLLKKLDKVPLKGRGIQNGEEMMFIERVLQTLQDKGRHAEIRRLQDILKQRVLPAVAREIRPQVDQLLGRFYG
jgi:hypothetical protein